MSIARALLVSVLLAGGCATTKGALTAGKPAPDFALPMLDGGSLGLAQLRGSVAIVDFWASWCGPCREELPALEKLRAEYEPRGARFVAVNIDDDAAAAAAAAQRLGLTMPVLLDAQKVAAQAFQPPTMPTSYVLDREGLVRFVHEGFNGAGDVEKLKAELEQLLAPAGAAAK